MNVLLIIAVSTCIQALMYWLCARMKVKIFDYAVLCGFLFLNSKVFTNLFLPESDATGNCAYSYTGFGMMMFLLVGNGFTVAAFIIYTIMRKHAERKNQE